MNNLMRSEIFKLQRNRTFWVTLVSVTGLSVLLHYLILIDWWQITGTTYDSAGIGELNALTMFSVPMFFNLIISPLAAFFISIEFSQSGVIKNQLISGHKRFKIYLTKFIVLSLGSIVLAVLIPVMTGLILIVLTGNGDTLSDSNLIYLGKSYGLFILQLLGYIAILLVLAIITEDSGKTIIFSILFTILMFAIEKFQSLPIINLIYENSIFRQFNEVFNANMTSVDMIKSIIIGAVSLIILVLCGILVFNKKEIK
ncbi:ABC transporter permease [Ornithinibacillus halotolerans]|uniref:ABC transporter permease n=1 Tax=Ornithinibacillus halotolerans TaxID=1274357 RepID=A0A916S0A0_9BACI|nr:ABC transporter permease [Ornithinibacillus halotolerans]GGA78583.1 hypothetical protein GCM10008025_22580 [Ornithinibacillus halotolerans]